MSTKGEAMSYDPIKQGIEAAARARRNAWRKEREARIAMHYIEHSECGWTLMDARDDWEQRIEPKLLAQLQHERAIERWQEQGEVCGRTRQWQQRGCAEDAPSIDAEPERRGPLRRLGAWLADWITTLLACWAIWRDARGGRWPERD